MPREVELHMTSLQGRRPTNEDVELYKLNLKADGSVDDPKYAPVDFFVVCDGHGGSRVSKFVAPELMKYLMDPSLVYPLDTGLINRIYSRIQNSIINHPGRIGRDCGCTALVVVRYERGRRDYLQVINLGDCRAVLSRRGLAIPLSIDHKPFWSDEKRRIDLVNRANNTNYRVHFADGDWRIHDLSVSRAFGDLDATPHVTHIPESFIHPLKAEDEFVIIACDGLWDTVQNHEAVNFVRDHLYNNNIEYYNIRNSYPSHEIRNLSNVSRKIASYAIARGSGDNVSVFTVIFDKK